MASFTSQAGIADINNSASLTRAIMSAPSKNHFLGIKIPKSLQSENSTENQLTKLKMKTEMTRNDSILAGDKLAVQKLNMLKAQNEFDRGMSNKEFALKDAKQTFDINDSATRTNMLGEDYADKKEERKFNRDMKGYTFDRDTDIAYKELEAARIKAIQDGDLTKQRIIESKQNIYHIDNKRILHPSKKN